MWLIWLKCYLGTYYYILLTYAKIKTYVKVKIVFESHKDLTLIFFRQFHIFCPITSFGKSDKSQKNLSL